MYHAIILNKQFKDPEYPKEFETFAIKISGDWTIYGVKVEDEDLEDFIKEIQEETIPNEPWYAHAYNDDELIVIFKEKVFRVTPHKSTWQPVFDYGITLDIPEDQLTFWPNRFQDERHYFVD